MKINRNINLCLFVLSMIVVSCVARLTNEQRTLWAVNVYNAQYDLYLEQVIDPTIVPEDRDMLKADPKLITPDMINPDLSEDQKKILREKKKVLVELHPIILLVDDLRKSGGQPSAEVENKLIELINRLIVIVED